MFTFAKFSLYVAVSAASLTACIPAEAAHSLVFAGSGQQSPAIQASLSLSLRAVQDVVQAGSPVMVEFTATNITGQSVQYSCWILIPCGLEVRDENGNEPPDTKLHRRSRLVPENSPNVAAEELLTGSLGLGVLAPGEAKASVIDVDAWYDFSQPGTYTIEVVQTSLSGQLWLKSNPITVNVISARAAQPAPPTAQTPASRPPFSLTIEMDSHPRFPVGLTVKTKNTSGHRLLLRTEKASNEQAGSVYKVDARDANGAPPPDSEFAVLTKNRDESSPPLLPLTAPRGGGVSLSLKPGEDWVDSIMLNKVYTLNKSGQYTIQVRRWDDETKAWVKSNIVTVTLDQAGRVQPLR